MRDILLLAIHVLTNLVKLLRPSGARAIVAESLVLKHQLLILNRSRKRAPYLTVWDRLLLGLGTLVVNPKHGTGGFSPANRFSCNGSFPVGPERSVVTRPASSERKLMLVDAMSQFDARDRNRRIGK
jgi:hypothetical protein